MLHTVFVYGTLKRGYGNNRLLATAHFLGAARTVDTFTMRDVGFPAILHNKRGVPVVGELYDVDDATLAQLDRLEGVAHGMYRREVVQVNCHGNIYRAHTYIAASNGLRRGGDVVQPNAVNMLDWQSDSAFNKHRA